MQFFTASDGARIAYRDEGAGTPFVFLHGLLAHGGFFRAQAELAERQRLITLDLRGHGQSPANGRAPSIERIARDVGELAAALDLEGAIGVGWSLGAAVLWRVLASNAGGRFAGAVIVDMTPRVLNDAGWSLGLTAEACAARSAAIRDDFTAFAQTAAQGAFTPGAAALPGWAAQEFAGNDPRAMSEVWESLVREDSRALLGRILQPSLIVHGARSQLYGPATAAWLAEALADARVERFDASGHAPHLEEPERFNLLLSDFAARLSRASTPQSSVSQGDAR